LFVSGRKDWGPFQESGVLENMKDICLELRGVGSINGVGHWLPQEKP
jgi:hypothetical protein